jgi:Holliday junction resolvasome RuvABC endonuclease subunit
MKILAIDPATSCGWALSESMSGVWDLRVRPDESTGMRLIRFRGKLEEVFRLWRPELVAYEASRNLKFGKAIAVAGELAGVLKVCCTDAGLEFIGFSATEIKKHATGKGNAGKDQMVEAARRRFPTVNIVDDNHADALWILSLAKERYGMLAK